MEGLMLEYEDSGTGEPVVCIHGALIADTFRPLRSERRLASRYRLITYRRRGYVGSSAVGDDVSVAQAAEDCRRLLSHLGVERAHLVGHSFGGAVALQLALDEPQVVQTVSLLEPALTIGESAHLYRQGLVDSRRRYREVGADTAVDEFLRTRWPGYRDHLEHVLPGAFEQAVADARTSFEADLPAALGWRFGKTKARRVTQPVLVVLGEKSVDLHPRFAETQQLLLRWLPKAEGFTLPRATHFLQVEHPRVMAGTLADFCRRHPLRERRS
jgi:pimeloyl-ACP methyl ester carboxylesterase